MDEEKNVNNTEVFENEEQTASMERGFKKERQHFQQKRSNVYRKKVCRLCARDAQLPDYKNPEALKRWTTERGKILPARITGTCAKHQRMVAEEIKKARNLALLPFDRK